VGVLVARAEGDPGSVVAPTLLVGWIPAIKAGWLCPAGNPDRIEQIDYLVKSGQVDERLSWKERRSEIHAH
jgi:hypothetical protein